MLLFHSILVGLGITAFVLGIGLVFLMAYFSLDEKRRDRARERAHDRSLAVYTLRETRIGDTVQTYTMPSLAHSLAAPTMAYKKAR